MRLILHPGHAKCGSTTIQRFLSEQRRTLQQNGVLFPDCNLLTPGSIGFNWQTETPREFIKEVVEENNIDLFSERLQSIMASREYKAVIISAENLLNYVHGPGRVIHEVLRNTFSEIKVIYYIKPQDTYILSAWQQWGYKTGVSLMDYVSRSIQDMHPNYLSIVKGLESIYGQANISVTPLVKVALHEGELIEDFLYASGIDISGKHTARQMNRSLSPLLCEILSERKHIFSGIHDESIKRMLVELTKNSDLLYTRFDEIIPLAQRKRILTKFSRHNRYLHATYFPHVDFHEVFRIGEMKAGGNGHLKVIERLSKENRVLRALLGEIIAELKVNRMPQPPTGAV